MQQTASKETLRSYLPTARTVRVSFPDNATACRFATEWNKGNSHQASVYQGTVYLLVSGASTIGHLFELAADWFKRGVGSSV